MVVKGFERGFHKSEYVVLLFPRENFCLSMSYPDGAPLFWKRGGKAPGVPPLDPRFIIGARKDTLFLLSFPFVPAIELLNGQRLRRNYESAIKPGFYGGSTYGNCTRPFLLDHLPRSGFIPFLIQQLQEATTTTHSKLPGTAF